MFDKDGKSMGGRVCLYAHLPNGSIAKIHVRSRYYKKGIEHEYLYTIHFNERICKVGIPEKCIETVKQEVEDGMFYRYREIEEPHHLPITDETNMEER